MLRGLKNVVVVSALGVTLMSGFSASATVSSSIELTDARTWTSNAFGISERAEATPANAGGLVIVRNLNEVWKNGRVDLPLMLGKKAYRRGLFCHASSSILVRLPGKGKSFNALVGVDTNSQTQGGQGSIEFSVKVGDSERFKSPVMREGMPPVPVSVELDGASEFTIEVGDAGDGIACDQADWADAKVTLEDGRTLWIGDLPILEGQPESVAQSKDLPFSFQYGDISSRDLLSSISPTQSHTSHSSHTSHTSHSSAPAKTEHTLTWRDPKTGLEVRCVLVEYRDYPTVEWTLHFKNTGKSDTPILSNIQTLDVHFDRRADDFYAKFARPGEFKLHHATGSICAPNDYQPHETPLPPNAEKHITTSGGRPTNSDMPYFNIEWPGQGVIAVIGWPGQWAAAFKRDTPTGLRITGGQELTHFTLHPGEEVRSPLVVLQFYKGDSTDAQNVWRRWMMAHNVPRPGGKLWPMHLSGCSSHFFGEMVKADEASQFQFIDRYLDEKIPMDYWWMDAGWYIIKSDWPNTGTWEVDTTRFPRGLRSITDHAHKKGVKTIVWFEPERVTPGTWLYDNHKDWLLGKDGEQKLLNLGNDAARKWLTDHVDDLLKKQGIDLYRQDFNMDPLDYWRANDAPDRQGITEIRHVTGYLAYWDELRRRHPNMLIDTCASGGRRNDLETLRRAVPLWRSDYILEPVGVQNCTYGISSWIPLYGTGIKEADPYLFRSCMTPYANCLWDARRTDLNYDLLRKLTSQWKEIAPNFTGDYYPITSYSLENDVWMAWQFDRPEQGQGMLQVFRRANSIYRSADFPLRGLDADSRYTVTDLDKPDAPYETTGRELMDHGITVEIPNRPGAGVITYKISTN